MLHHLYIRNYALFAEVAVDVPAGLVILTGETGAGKSLLVGALGLIMGKRADSSVVFREEEKCVVEARFHRLSPATMAQLAHYDDFDLADQSLIIRREISPAGKSRAFINDTPVTLDLLRDVCSLLVDLHGQHENQSLLNTDRQRELLDLYAGNEALLGQFAQELKACESLRREIQALEAQESSARQQLEFLRFQQEDLAKADLKANEEHEIEEELRLLQNSAEVIGAVGGGAEILYLRDDSVYLQISTVLENLRKVRHVSQTLEEEVLRLEEMGQQIKDSAMGLQRLLDTVEADPQRLAYLESRLATYHQLRLKYGKKDGQELLDLLSEVTRKMEEFSSLEERIQQKKQALGLAQEQLARTGSELEARRLEAKPQLEDKIIGILRQVGFEKARFEVAVERMSHADGWLPMEAERLRPASHGFNRVYFMIQANPGMPAGPLGQIASGGEISRVMLAIKAALADRSEFPVLIFDEIDTGISGEIANKVGLVMRDLSRRFQILSITHLPQIAAKGNAHLRISKEVLNDMTTSSVALLTEENRVLEIAKMLSGDSPSDSAMRHAAELMRG